MALCDVQRDGMEVNMDYSNKEEVINALLGTRLPEQIKEIMEKTSNEIKNDSDFYRQLGGFKIYAYKYMGQELRNDEEFILEHVDECIYYASEKLTGSKEFMTKALQKAVNPRKVVHSASLELKKDKSFILDALAHDDEGYLVLEADIEIQKSPDIQAVVLTKYEPEQTLKAIKQNIAEVEKQGQETNTLLQQKEVELSSLEEEAKIIAEAEVLIKKQTEKEGQDIGEN